MAYERLSDEESRDRVAAIIAAAEALAGDEVKAERPARPAGSPTAKGGSTTPYRRWAIAVGAAALTLGGLIVWTKVTEGVTVDQSEPPQVLLAEDPNGTDPTTVSTVPGASTSVAPATTGGPTTTGAGATTTTAAGATTTGAAPVTTGAGTPVSTAVPIVTTPATTVAPGTTVAPTTTVAVPTTTVPAPTTTVAATEGPHSRNDPAIESFVSYASGGMTIIGRVPNQAAADLVQSRAQEFLPVSVLDNFLEIDPAAQAPIPLFELSSEFIFDGDSPAIRLEFSPQIIQMATTLKNRPNTTIDIYVHTDSHADAATVLEQTRQQAESLKSIFMAQGVDASRIHLFPKGDTQALGDSSTYDGYLLNRRVEFVVNGLYS